MKRFWNYHVHNDAYDERSGPTFGVSSIAITEEVIFDTSFDSFILPSGVLRVFLFFLGKLSHQLVDCIPFLYKARASLAKVGNTAFLVSDSESKKAPTIRRRSRKKLSLYQINTLKAYLPFFLWNLHFTIPAPTNPSLGQASVPQPQSQSNLVLCSFDVPIHAYSG